jgi:PAS domain S-box-containing protein
MEALKSNASDAYLPVIVLTAEPAHKLRALQAGAKDFISKPFDLVEVKTRIHNMLEVRLLYRMLDAYNLLLEQKVQERTAELSESQDRFRSLTELASDWYWEQNENGHYTTVSGPVFEIMGISITELLNKNSRSETRTKSVGWDEVERKLLQNKIESRQPFLDMSISRTNSDGTKQAYRVSGEPIFNRACNFTGYRGIGTEVLDLY